VTFSRAAAEPDAVLGVLPGIVYEPATVEEAAQVVGDSARRRLALVFVGGGTDLELGGAPARMDAIVRTARLDRILEYKPSDQIVAVEAGITLARLQAALAAHRQRLALDPPSAERKSIGGIIAANAYGPRRARFGSVRDLLIGISFVRADGASARGGGKVVKNVAGFDLPKLMVGSLGTLGLITTATFRLHPLPEEEVTAIREAQLEPASVVAVRRGDGRYDVAVSFEGFRAGVAEQRERLTRLAGTGTGAACEVLDTEAAAAFRARHDELRTTCPLRAKVAALPAQIEPIAADVLPPLLGSLEEPGFVWYATLGVGFVGGTPEERGADSTVRALHAARERLSGLGGTLTLEAAPGETRARMDVWGQAPGALPLMKAVKERLDPERRFAPGRFVGGI
jgi:glycolate oxidase FAD binding subunit